MSIVIFGDLFSFPEGQAATNRVYTYARGFIEHGQQVHVICFLSEYADHYEGITPEGIHYHKPFRQKERSHNFFVRRWQNLLKYHRTWRILKKIHRTDRVLAVNSWTNLFGTLFFISCICRLLGIRVITECSEHPMLGFMESRLGRFRGKLKFRAEAILCDGILCISRYLMDYHRNNGVPERKLFLVPSTVDPTRFEKPAGRPLSGSYIGYFGSLTFSRDSVDVLIKAYAIFNKNCPGPKLVLGGFCSPEMKTKMLELIEELGIRDHVIVLEYLSRQDVLAYISNADLLVMARSRDLASAASYPSKLTEFLATGKPVISMNVGEVADFLIDGENAFLVEPEAVEGLAGKMEYVFAHPQEAARAGQKGQELTRTVFHYKFQAGRILEFFKSLNK